MAIGDEVGELLDARMVIILIGGRPGLSSPDSLGLHLTYAPRAGLTEAASQMLRATAFPTSAAKGSVTRKPNALGYLLREAFARRLAGVQLKDQADQALLASDKATCSAPRNVLLPDA
ncbi:ethanolamine ammonia-lyase light chain EutC [Xanthomonas melonis]|uniref:ethanolamine ammonia-lyase light chain EutC n=1 Tax=Xanthomonas melonis TaxID=56456 RepID=UPI003EBE4F6F